MAFVIVILIVFIARTILRRIRHIGPQDTTSVGSSTFTSKFSDIIRTRDMDPSLSIFQFLLWTIVIIFAFTGVYFTRILGGVYDPPRGGIPVSLLALMGISVATPIISNVVSSYKYSPFQFYEDPSLPAKVGGTTQLAAAWSKVRPNFGEMLREYGKPTLARFQMFGWTWISIIIYLFILFSTVISTEQLQNLTLPDIDPTLVVLMGLSQFAYLGIKAGSTEMQITSIYPLEGKTGDPLSIYGRNFGKQGQIVWLGKWQIKYSDGHIQGWDDERIDITIPPDIPAGTHDVIVAKGGAWIKAKDQFTVKETALSNNPPKAEDNQTVRTEPNTPVDIALKAADPDKEDTLTFSKVRDPSYGILSRFDSSTGQVTYTPNKDHVGSDSFTFKANDGKVDSNLATVAIIISKSTSTAP
jgi:hypothetical protein